MGSKEGILQTPLLKAFKERDNFAQPSHVIVFPEITYFSTICTLIWHIFFLYL